MNWRPIILISFSVLVILILGVYGVYQKRASNSLYPTSLPPALSAEERLKILSTLEAKKKENLTPQQKEKILNSLTAPL